MSLLRLRTPALVAALLAVALTISSCGVVGRSAAATVNGTRISADAVEDELIAIRQNEQYRQAVEAEIGGSITGEARGTFDSSFAARVVTLRIYYELAEEFLREREAEISEQDLGQARDQVVAQVGGDQVFESFPRNYQELLVRRSALIEVVERELGDFRSEEAVEEYYEENQDEFAEVCVSHILVDSEEQAVQARSRIDDGEEFAEVAQEVSTDPGSAQEGGDLGCRARGTFVQEFEEAAFSLPEGQLSEPVETPFGWHVMLVRERRVPPLEEARPQVQQRLSILAQETFTEWLSEATSSARVDVSPRYGEWVVRDLGGQQIGQVVPSEGPTTTIAG